MDLLEVIPDYENNNNSSFESSVADSRSAPATQLYIFPDHELNLLIHEFIFTQDLICMFRFKLQRLLSVFIFRTAVGKAE
jgi:hypothetical protein